MAKTARQVRGPRRADADAERIGRAIAMRVRGATYDAIAKECGYCDRSSAQRAVQGGLAKRQADSIDQMREIANEQLAMVIEGHAAKANTGNARSGEVVIKAIERHARINGYDAPTKTEVTGADGGPVAVTTPHDELLARVARLVAAAAAGTSDPKPDGGGGSTGSV